MEDKRKSLLRLLEQGEFKPKGPKTYIELEEPPEVVKDIITRIKKEEGLRYADAYGILLLTKEYLEYEANFLSPIFSKKEIE